MSDRKAPGIAFEVTGLILFLASGMTFVMILWQRFGWEFAALAACLAFGTVGFRMCWGPASGSAGTGAGARGSDAGVPFAVALDPEDPDAGIPRRPA